MTKIIKKLSDPKIFVYTIMWMMILVFIGTIAQRDMGLYYAQQKYFSNWLAWLGPLPTPGGRLTMLVMFINMLAMLYKSSLWQWKKIGVLIVHLGAMLLLIGGGITAWFSFEGNMVLNEGGQSNFIVNSQQSELAFINTTEHDFKNATQTFGKRKYIVQRNIRRSKLQYFKRISTAIYINHSRNFSVIGIHRCGKL